MSKKEFLNLIINTIRDDNNNKKTKNWRGTLSNWIKC